MTGSCPPNGLKALNTESDVRTRGSSWKKSHGGQQLAWQSNMKNVTKDLAVAVTCRLPHWGPRDSSHQ